MTVTSDLPVDTATRPRIEVFDGLRGIAIVLVILSHGWTIWPNTGVMGNGILRAPFSSGNFAVSIFFVIGSYLAVTAMLRERDRTGNLSVPSAKGSDGAVVSIGRPVTRVRSRSMAR